MNLKFAFLFLALSVSAFAATNIPDDHIIYTWGYANLMNEILQAVRSAIGSIDFVVKSALALAFFIFAINKAMDNRNSPVFELGKLLLLYAVVYNFFLSAKNDEAHRFQVWDEITTEAHIIDEIPYGLGITFALTSRLEKGILEIMEQNFSTPQSLNYRSTGLGFSTSMVNNFQNLRVKHLGNEGSKLQSDYAHFHTFCLTYAKARAEAGLAGGISKEKFAKSNDLINDVLLAYKGKEPVATKNGTLHTCESLGTSIADRLKVLAASPAAMAMVSQGVSQISQINKQNGVDAIFKMYSGGQQASREGFQQIMAMNMVNDSAREVATLVGMQTGEFAGALSAAQYTFQTSMATQMIMAQKYLPIAKAYITALVVGLSWLVLIFSLVFGDYRHVKLFFTLMLWMMMWTPILCIINYFSDIIKMNEIDLARAAGLNADDFGWNLTDRGRLEQSNSDQAAFMGYLVMLTPMLAYSIVKASEMGFVQVATSLSQAMQGAARTAGMSAMQAAQSTSSQMARRNASGGEDVWVEQGGMTSMTRSFESQGRMLTQKTNFSKSGDATDTTFSDNYNNTATMNADGNFLTGQHGKIGFSVNNADNLNSQNNKQKGFGENTGVNHTQGTNLNSQNTNGAGTVNIKGVNVNNGITNTDSNADSSNTQDTKSNESGIAPILRGTGSALITGGSIAMTAGGGAAMTGIGAAPGSVAVVGGLVATGTGIALNTVAGYVDSNTHSETTSTNKSNEINHGTNIAFTNSKGASSSDTNTSTLSSVKDKSRSDSLNYQESNTKSFANGQSSSTAVSQNGFANVLNNMTGGAKSLDGLKGEEFFNQAATNFSNALNQIDSMNSAQLQGLARSAGIDMTTQDMVGDAASRAAATNLHTPDGKVYHNEAQLKNEHERNKKENQQNFGNNSNQIPNYADFSKPLRNGSINGGNIKGFGDNLLNNINFSESSIVNPQNSVVYLNKIDNPNQHMSQSDMQNAKK